MEYQKGYIHWVVVTLISIMAVGLVGIAWWYEENKTEETKVSSSVTNVATQVYPNSTDTTAQDIDDHGCDVSGGYYWCELSKTCIDHAVEDCIPTASNSSVESVTNEGSAVLQVEINNTNQAESVDTEEVAETNPVTCDGQTPLEPITDEHPISYIGGFNIPTNWIEYTDDTNGFTFKYPPDWNLLEPPAGETGLQIAPPNISEREDYVARNLHIVAVDCGYSKGDLSEIETLVLKGNYAQTAMYMNAEGETELHTYIPNGDSHFVIKWASDQDEAYSEYGRIRSTFDFDINTINQWPVYSNNFGKFSVTFPDEWNGYSFKDTSGAYYEITFEKEIVETRETVYLRILEGSGLFEGYNWIDGYTRSYGYKASDKPTSNEAIAVWEQIPEILGSFTAGSN
ncbi:MAG: hypothetical protein V1685_02110 [Parcubacteria group bacterium]